MKKEKKIIKRDIKKEEELKEIQAQIIRSANNHYEITLAEIDKFNRLCTELNK